MDTPLTKDARGFVDGVVSYLKNDSRSKSAMPRVQAFLGKVTARARKEKIAIVETSVSLTQAEKTGLEAVLAGILGHEVNLDETVKPELLGGYRIQVGDWIVDQTIKSQLEQMATVLTQ